MLQAVVPFLNKALPVGLAVKGLAASHPKISSFLAAASVAGYPIDSTLNFMRSVFESPGKKRTRERLSKREEQGLIQPDEAQTLDTLRPSRETKLAEKAISLAGKASAGAIYSRIGRGSKAIIPEVLPAVEKKVSPKNLEYERKEIGFSPRTKEPEHRFPKPKTPPPSPIPPDIEEKIRFHMEKSGLSVDDAIEVTSALDPSTRKTIQGLKKKGAFANFAPSQQTTQAAPQQAPSPSGSDNELSALLNKLAELLASG